MRHIIIILKFLFNNFLIIIFILIAIYRLTIIRPSEESQLVFLNVGQGDAILIQQGYFQMLVDTGPDDTLLYELPKYMPENDRTIEVILLTHSHDDHIQGLFSILNNYKVQNIMYESQCFQSKDFEQIQSNYEEIIHNIPDKWSLEYRDISISAIYPFDVVCHTDVNQDSIVLKLKIKDTAIILVGDAGFEAEEYLLKNDLISQADILKVGHHCSRSATSDMFLSKAFPSIAICSCGEDNSFGHPHSETIEKFKKHHVQYLITYQTGNVVFKF